MVHVKVCVYAAGRIAQFPFRYDDRMEGYYYWGGLRKGGG